MEKRDQERVGHGEPAGSYDRWVEGFMAGERTFLWRLRAIEALHRFRGRCVHAVFGLTWLEVAPGVAIALGAGCWPPATGEEGAARPLT